MSSKRNFFVNLAVSVLVGLLKGIIKGHYDVEREAMEEWNKEEQLRFARSFEENTKK